MPFLIRPRTQKILAFTALATLLVLLAGYFIFHYTSLGKRYHPASFDKSIAVLPFKNTDNTEGYFSDGMTEEIINLLARGQELKVLSATSVDQYKEQTNDLRTIANDLGVSYILEGSVSNSGGTFRISVQLIRAETGSPVWSHEYDNEMSNVLQVQSEISREVTNALKITLTESEKKNLENTGTVQLAAYDFYLRARSELMNHRVAGPEKGSDHASRAIGLFKNSLAADSTFARAYSGLGLAYYYKGDYGASVNLRLLDSANVLADKALQLDGNTEEAFFLKGLYDFHHGQNDEAIVEFNKALKVNPNYADVLMHLGSITNATKQDYVTGLSQMESAVQRGRGPELASNLRGIANAYHWLGLFDKSTAFFRSAGQLDGDSAGLLAMQAQIARFNHQYDEALRLVNEALHADSSNWSYANEKAWVLASMGKYHDALETRLDWEKKHPNPPAMGMNRIGYLYWTTGDPRMGIEYFRRMIELEEENIRLNRPEAQYKFSQYDLAGVFAFLEEKEKAYAYLDEVNQRSFIPFWLVQTMKVDPLLDKLRSEERFKKIARDMEGKYIAEKDKVLGWLGKSVSGK